MKHLLVIASLVFVSVCLFSCEKADSDEHPNNEATEENTVIPNYYVKYQFSCAYRYSLSFSVETDTGPQSFSGIYAGWSETYGPVSKGFHASIRVNASANVKIYVSRGQEPFVLKASGDNSASYTIDF